jgi:REP element-mobilizing transposase RayT
MSTGDAHPGNANLPIGEDATRDKRGADLGSEEPANQETGVPSEVSTERWHSRWYLPHFESPERIQHVTLHLADSLAKEALDRMTLEVQGLPASKRKVELRKKVEGWADAGHGSCVLREPEIAAMAEKTLLHFDGERYHLLAWVVMPNHIHVLFEPINGWTMAKAVASWKKFTARKILAFQRQAGTRPLGNANLPIGESPGALDCSSVTPSCILANREIGVPRIGVPSAPVWHREYCDRFMRDERHLQNAIQYIHYNPVSAGLVDRAEAWVWGSARLANQEIGAPTAPIDRTRQRTEGPRDYWA